MTCTYPVRAGDDDKSLLARYGSEARVATIPGPEGTELVALVLWPDDQARRIEIPYQDEERTRLGSLMIRSPHAAWRVANIGIGSSLERVEEANGKAFTVAGFGWDYGGYADLRDGSLTRLPGGCGVSLRFDVKEGVELPAPLLGDGAQIMSSDRRLRAAAPTVSQIAVRFEREK